MAWAKEGDGKDAGGLALMEREPCMADLKRGEDTARTSARQAPNCEALLAYENTAQGHPPLKHRSECWRCGVAVQGSGKRCSTPSSSSSAWPLRMLMVAQCGAAAMPLTYRSPAAHMPLGRRPRAPRTPAMCPSDAAHMPLGGRSDPAREPLKRTSSAARGPLGRRSREVQARLSGAAPAQFARPSGAAGAPLERSGAAPASPVCLSELSRPRAAETIQAGPRRHMQARASDANDTPPTSTHCPSATRAATTAATTALALPLFRRHEVMCAQRWGA